MLGEALGVHDGVIGEFVGMQDEQQMDELSNGLMAQVGILQGALLDAYQDGVEVSESLGDPLSDVDQQQLQGGLIEDEVIE